MDRLDALRTFVAVAQQRSFAEAARALRVSPSAASRAVAAIEADLGVALLRRTTRSVGLTPEGAAYLARCQLALDSLDEAARSLRGEDAAPRGKLIVTAALVFGRMHILPIVTRLLRDHRDLQVQLVLNDRLVRLAEEGVDVAVRIATLADSALHAVRLGEVRRVLVASPGYLAAHRAPRDAAALREHDLIGFDGSFTNGEWRFGGAGRPAMRLEPRLLTNSAEAAVEAALDGLGIARALTYQVEAHIRTGRLRYILPELDPPALPVSLVFQESRRSSPNLRAFIAVAQAYFRSNPIGSRARRGQPHAPAAAVGRKP